MKYRVAQFHNINKPRLSMHESLLKLMPRTTSSHPFFFNSSCFCDYAHARIYCSVHPSRCVCKCMKLVCRKLNCLSFLYALPPLPFIPLFGFSFLITKHQLNLTEFLILPRYRRGEKYRSKEKIN